MADLPQQPFVSAETNPQIFTSPRFQKAVGLMAQPSMMWQEHQMQIARRYLVRWTTSFLIVGLVALMAIVAKNFWLGEQAQDHFDGAIAARDTRVAAVELRNAMQTAEASQRGFLITGNEIYLAPYQTAKAQAQRHLSALQTFVVTYPDMDAASKRLVQVLKNKFANLDATIALKRDRRDDEALALFRTNSGKMLTDEANVFFSGIIGQADSRLTSGVAEQRENTASLRLVSAIGAVLIVVVTGAAAFFTKRYTSELRRTQNQVDALNRDLEQRVASRTADLVKARDRAEVLISEVNHRVANSLALVSSLVNIQSKSLVDPAAKDALAETQDRILAISLVHKRLYETTDVRSVELAEYLTGLLDHLRSSMHSQAHGLTLSADIEAIELDTDASINLGVVVTELVTNAFKYAYPDKTGQIRVQLRRLPGDQAELIVEDDGIGRVDGAPAKGTGVGTRIVKAMCANLNARIEYQLRQPGTTAYMVFSVNRRLGAAA